MESGHERSDDQHRSIASFDVFDTVLTRRVGSPDDAFVVLGRSLRALGLIDCSAEAFARHRRAAEVRAFRNAGGIDSRVSLTHIHTELVDALGLSPDATKVLYDEELAVERELLTVVGAGADLVEAARKRGDRVIFVSDMYLPATELESELRRAGLFLDGDGLYVSNELGRSKSTGSIWPVVLEREGVPASHFVHVGNDAVGDVRRTRRAGLGARHFDEGNSNQFEHELSQWSSATDGAASALAAASRIVRTSVGGRPAREQALVDVAAGAIAPLLVSYLTWVLRSAKAADIERLYFVARDGYLLRKMAVVLAPLVGYDGELAYLYGSRQAWALPSLVDGEGSILDTLCPTTGDVDHVTPRTITRRLGIEPEAIEGLLTAVGVDPSAFDRAVTAADRARLRETLRARVTLEDELMECAAASRANLVDYLRVEGVLDDGTIGLVDIGTGATLHNALSAVLASEGRPPPTSFYMAVREDVVDRGYGVPNGWLRDVPVGLGYGRTPGVLTALEMVCTTDHGSVTGYTRLPSGKVAPTFAEPEASVAEWGLPIVHDALMSVARLLRRDVFPTTGIDLRGPALAAFDCFWRKPTTAQADAWGSYPIEDGWGDEAVHHSLAGRRSVRTAIRGAPHRHAWETGAARLSRPIPRALVLLRLSGVEGLRRIGRTRRS